MVPGAEGRALASGAIVLERGARADRLWLLRETLRRAVAAAVRHVGRGFEGSASMASGNAIIVKEFVQASHRRRTYWVRAGIPIAGILVVLPQIVMRIAMGGTDWRVMAELARHMGASLVILAQRSKARLEMARAGLDLAILTYAPSDSPKREEAFERFFAVMEGLGLKQMCRTPLNFGMPTLDEFKALVSSRIEAE